MKDPTIKVTCRIAAEYSVYSQRENENQNKKKQHLSLYFVKINSHISGDEGSIETDATVFLLQKLPCVRLGGKSLLQFDVIINFV